MTAPLDPILIALQVAKAFERLDIPYTIGGSIASSLAGEPRSTVDVDFVAQLTEDTVTPFAAALESSFYVSEESLHRAVRDLTSANLIHHATSIKVDVFVAGGTPIDLQQLARRQPIRVAGDQVLFVHPPEDILLQKLRWYRKGGEVSDRQWRDIIGIVRVQTGRLDRTYLATNAELLGVSDLLGRALRDA